MKGRLNLIPAFRESIQRALRRKNVSMGKAAGFPSYGTSLVFCFMVRRKKVKGKKTI